MTIPKSSDSLLPDPRPISEADARIEAALRVVNDIVTRIAATDPDVGSPRDAVMALGVAILQIKHILESR